MTNAGSRSLDRLRLKLGYVAFCYSFLAGMVVVIEVVNSRGLNFANQRKVVVLRDKKLPNGRRLPWYGTCRTDAAQRT